MTILQMKNQRKPGRAASESLQGLLPSHNESPTANMMPGTPNHQPLPPVNNAQSTP